MATVQAGDWAFRPVDWSQATYTAEFGLRFWYGNAKTGKNLFYEVDKRLKSQCDELPSVAVQLQPLLSSLQ